MSDKPALTIKVEDPLGNAETFTRDGTPTGSWYVRVTVRTQQGLRQANLRIEPSGIIALICLPDQDQ